MNLAIIIGVSEYKQLNALPACRNDVHIINDILISSKKYEKILLIDKPVSSSDVKGEITSFIRDNKSNAIDELFFYYSGHGLFRGDEFYYAMPDCDLKKLKQTTLENSDIDMQIRSLSPELTVKVIDACQSGVEYIKDFDVLGKYMHEKTNEFKHCYFMLSSNSSQSSYADNTLSHFTKAFVESISNSTANDIRYKDIMDYISDDFNENRCQTPVFISQANFTEIFISPESDLKVRLGNQLRGMAKTQLDKVSTTATLAERIKADAARYFSEDKAMKMFDMVSDYIYMHREFSNEGDGTFRISLEKHEKYIGLPNIEQVSEWAHSNESNFFVSSIRKDVVRKNKVIKPPSFLDTLTSSFGNKVYEYVEETISVPNSVQSTVKLPFSFISVKAESEFENVNSSKLYIILFISKTQMAILNSFTRFSPLGWEGEEEIIDDVKWNVAAFPLIDEGGIKEYIDDVWEVFEKFSLAPIKSALGVTNEEQLEFEVARGTE